MIDTMDGRGDVSKVVNDRCSSDGTKVSYDRGSIVILKGNI